MREVLGRAGDLARPVALVWGGLLAPFELASALSALLSRPPAHLSWQAVALVGGRVVAAVLGLLVARQLLQRDPETGRLARRWVVLDLVTLALVLTTATLPSNRLPGTAWQSWTVYAMLDLSVLLAAQRLRDAAVGPMSDTRLAAPERPR